MESGGANPKMTPGELHCPLDRIAHPGLLPGMVDDSSSTDAAGIPASPEAQARAERAARLGAALRANLRRRKASRTATASDSDLET